jgi:fatty acid desaturase
VRLVLCLGLDAVALALLAAGIFLALPWLFAGFVVGNLAVCLHFERRSPHHRVKGNPWPK